MSLEILFHILALKLTPSLISTGQDLKLPQDSLQLHQMPESVMQLQHIHSMNIKYVLMIFLVLCFLQ